MGKKIKSIIWGVGGTTIDFLQKKIMYHDFEIVCFTDNNSNLWGKTFHNNLPIVSPDELCKIDYDIVIICSLYFKEIKEQLKSDDLDEETRAELEKELKDGVDEKLADTDKINAAYLRRAIKKVKPTITDETIDKYKETYGDFAWAVAFAPADDPEIAVAAVVPQGTTSTYAFLPIKDVIGYYMVGSKNSDSNSDNKTDTKNTDKDNNSTDKNNSDSINNDNSSATGSDNKLNFNVQIKK